MGAAGSGTSTRAQGKCGGTEYPLVPAARMAAMCRSGRGRKAYSRLDMQKGELGHEVITKWSTRTSDGTLAETGSRALTPARTSTRTSI